MNNSVFNKLLSDVNSGPATSSCSTVSPCTQDGCPPPNLESEKVVGESLGFAAPSQQQNSTQAFQAAPGFLC